MNQPTELFAQLSDVDAELEDLELEFEETELGRQEREALEARYAQVGEAWGLSLKPGQPDADQLVGLMDRMGVKTAKGLREVAHAWGGQMMKPSNRLVDDKPWGGMTATDRTNPAKVVSFLRAFLDLLS